MTAEEVLKKVKLIELKSKRRLNSSFLGEYNSSFKGVGMTFSELRPYQFGDDVRKIDWNKTAHFHEPLVKIFEEEREMMSILLIDVSGSMNYGTRKQFKNETATEISAVLAFSAIKNNDKVGLILFSDKIEAFIPPKKGNAHVIHIIKTILNTTSVNKSANLNLCIDFLLKTIKRKASIFLISDFDIGDYEKKLCILSKKHQVTGIRIYDRVELNFPDIGWAHLKDLETGDLKWVNTSNKSVREQYSKEYKKLLLQTKNVFTKCGSGFINIATDQDYIKELFNYFKERH